MKNVIKIVLLSMLLAGQAFAADVNVTTADVNVTTADVNVTTADVNVTTADVNTTKMKNGLTQAENEAVWKSVHGSKSHKISTFAGGGAGGGVTGLIIQGGFSAAAFLYNKIVE